MTSCPSRSHTRTDTALSATLLRMSHTSSGLNEDHNTPSSTNRIAKGDSILLPILAINRSKRLWGPDAYEFKYVIVSFLLSVIVNGYATDPNGGTTSPRGSSKVQASGVTCSRSWVDREHASATGSQSSSKSSPHSVVAVVLDPVKQTQDQGNSVFPRTRIRVRAGRACQ